MTKTWNFCFGSFSAEESRDLYLKWYAALFQCDHAALNSLRQSEACGEFSLADLCRWAEGVRNSL